MRGSAISEVVASKSKDYKAGEYVLATTGWTEFAIIKAKHVERLKLVGKHGIVPGDYQSVLGMTALTAYFGMINCGRIAEKPKGSTVVVSGAAGATGLIAGQIAKIYGMRVIGIAGGKQKCEFLKSVGFDEAVDYKSPTFYKDLCKVTPKFIDFFFDNTGGDILDACFKRAAFKSVFVICGAVSQYLKGKPVGPAYYTNIIAQRQRVEGFIVFDYESEYDSAREKLAEWYSQGKLTKQEHVVKGSVEELPQALQMLFDGKNTGKMVVHVDGASKAKL
jgi:NADPH-dependent curcumin reductase CurA